MRSSCSTLDLLYGCDFTIGHVTVSIYINYALEYFFPTVCTAMNGGVEKRSKGRGSKN